MQTIKTVARRTTGKTKNTLAVMVIRAKILLVLALNGMMAVMLLMATLIRRKAFH